ncbi:fimbrial protein [Stenotrophomonas sp. ATs4]|uniref:fimbrial protein n=1 Tax=Stenotrophomonas sp. ATs4 TaxID=3402766 RepID=UPI003F71C793
MSYRFIRTVALLVCTCAAPHALSATLTINGRVLPGTCTLATPAITLDNVKADELVQGDNKLKQSTLNFTGCVGVAKAKLSFDGTAADGDAQRWKNTAATGPASGVSVSLLAGATGTTYLKKGDTGIEVPVTGNTANYVLRAGYYLPVAAGVNAGAVQTAITITALYE